VRVQDRIGKAKIGLTNSKKEQLMVTAGLDYQMLQTGHVGFNVTDLDRSKKFYQDVLGFQIMGESQEDGRSYTFLGDGQRLVLTLWQQSEGRFAKHQPGLHHLSFQVEDMEQVEAYREKLHQLNVPLIYEDIVPHGEGTVSGGIYFEDPDGIRLEIYSPTGAENRPAPVSGAPTCGFF
jgi:catechol-2,3-dioxygenase